MPADDEALPASKIPVSWDGSPLKREEQAISLCYLHYFYEKYGKGSKRGEPEWTMAKVRSHLKEFCTPGVSLAETLVDKDDVYRGREGQRMYLVLTDSSYTLKFVVHSLRAYFEARKLHTTYSGLACAENESCHLRPFLVASVRAARKGSRNNPR